MANPYVTPEDQRPPKPSYTRLGKKYGHPIGPFHIPVKDSNPRKSDLTPLPSSPETASRLDRIRFPALQEHQRRLYHGFTTEEIETAEALASSYKRYKAPPLDNNSPIHPLFEMENWDDSLGSHLAKYPLGGGREGYWEAQNPVVWRAIKPSLQLATLFLTNPNTVGFWDTILKGKKEYIQPESGRLPNGGRDFPGRRFALLRERAPDVSGTEGARERVFKAITQMKGELKFRIVPARANYHTGLPKLQWEVFDWGNTFVPGPISQKRGTLKKDPVIHLALEAMEPLVNNDRLNDAERAVDVVRLATVILHELAHAFWHLVCVNDSIALFPSEPFYGNECTSELGYSLEHKLFGGVQMPLRFSVRGNMFQYSSGGGVLLGWDNFHWRNASAGRTPALNSIGAKYFWIDQSTIPSAFYQSLLQPDFWEKYVKQYGQQATRAGPQNIINRTYQNGPDQINLKLEEMAQNDIKIDESLPPAIQEAMKMEIARRKRARRIFRACTQLRSEREQALSQINDKLGQDPPVQYYKRLYEGIPGLPATATEDEKKEYRARVNLAHEEAEAELQEFHARRARCPKYTEIENYLILYRHELALDSMRGLMGEHVLFNHIMELGGLDIDATDWHEFLLISEMNKRLFIYKELGRAWGTLKFDRNGWPKTAKKARPRPLYFRPSKLMLEVFREICERVLRDQGVFEDSYTDHDWNDFKSRFNYFYKFHPDYPIRNRLGRRVTKFGRRFFNACVYYNYYKEKGVDYGPKGVLRWVNSYEEEQPTHNNRIPPPTVPPPPPPSSRPPTTLRPGPPSTRDPEDIASMVTSAPIRPPAPRAGNQSRFPANIPPETVNPFTGRHIESSEYLAEQRIQKRLKDREGEERELRRLMGDPESCTPSPEPEPDQGDRPATPPTDEVGDLPRMYGNMDLSQSLLSVYSTIRPSEVGMMSLAGVLAANNLGGQAAQGRVQSIAAASTMTVWPGGGPSPWIGETSAAAMAAAQREVVKKEENEAGLTERCNPM